VEIEMECTLIVLLVEPSVLSAERGSSGRPFERQAGLCSRPVHVFALQGAVADVSWAPRELRFPHPAPRRCGELRAAAGGQLVEAPQRSAAQLRGHQIAKASRRDA
jgi:hypothetical protein